MGRQGYMTRLTLGRSPYEPPEWEEGHINGSVDDLDSQNPQYTQTFGHGNAEYIQTYSVRGNPENLTSRSAARRLRRAQNDILATIGVCVSVDKNGKLLAIPGDVSSKEDLDARITKSIARENEMGYWIGTVEGLLLGVTGTFAEGLLERLLTFRFYAGTPLSTILLIELKQFGFLKLMYAGVPAHLTFYLLLFAKECVLSFLVRGISLWFPSRTKSRRRLRGARRLLLASEKILNAVAYVMLAPIQIFGTLQQIDLIPARALLPSYQFFSLGFISSLLIPPIPTSWNARSLFGFAVLLASSPLVLLTALDYVSDTINMLLTRYLRILLPVPSNPDEYSIKACPDGPHMRDNISRTEAQRHGTLTTEINKDMWSLVEIFANVPTACERYFGNVVCSLETFGDDFRRADREEVKPEMERLPGSDRTAVECDSPDIGASQSTATPSPVSSSFESNHGYEDDEDEDDEDRIATESQFRNGRVQISTRRGSADDTHEMNIEWNLSRRHTLDSLPHVPQLQQPGHGTAGSYQQGAHHRVTALSTYPTVALSSNLVSILSTIICLPLDSLYVRSVALAYLSVPLATPATQSAASLLRQNVYPLGSWFGLGVRGGWRGMGDYAGKLFLVVGIETMLRMGVWEFGVGCAWWLGRRWCQWGKL